MDISALLCILMACEKAGTAGVLGYPVILLLLQRYSITASFVKTVISFPATSTRIVCVYMASHSIIYSYTTATSALPDINAQA